MRRVWAAVLSIWALLALVAVLAWTRPPTPMAQPRATTAVIRTANGTRRVVLIAPPAHATTQTSPAAAQPGLTAQASTGITAAPSGGN
jgi:hypothetical protein